MIIQEKDPQYLVFVASLLHGQAHIVVAETHKGMLVLSLLRASRAVVAIGLLLNLVVVVGNACDTETLVILVLFELATEESYYDIPNTIRLLARTHSIETLLTIHIIHNI